MTESLRSAAILTSTVARADAERHSIAVAANARTHAPRYANASIVAAAFLIATCSFAHAAPAIYDIDPNHTHPSFEADHFDGLSVWRGFFRKTSGVVVLDGDGRSGTVEVAVATASIDFGQEALNAFAISPQMLDATQYPTAYFKGTLGGFGGGAPTTVTGEFKLRGVIRPLTLAILSFKCLAVHPLTKREVCGADATGVLNRADFGVTVGQQYGFRMEVTIRLQIEAIKRLDNAAR